MHIKDTTGAAAPAEPLRRAAAALSRGADHAGYNLAEPVDLAAVDAELATTLDFLLRNRRVEMLRNLSLRCSRIHGQMGRMLCGETVTIDAVALAQEIASIRSAIMILRAGDARLKAGASRGEHHHQLADRVQ